MLYQRLENISSVVLYFSCRLRVSLFGLTLFPILHPEVIIEAALCKSVLKPLREAIYSSLKDIHTRNGTLKRLRENQQVVLGTTTTDLGVTTCVPETPVMEKITLRLGRLHQEYSPQKKIDALLKTCKIIYESMSVGSPGEYIPLLCKGGEGRGREGRGG